MNANVRLTIPIPEGLWRTLRDVAETERSPSGRASIGAVVVRALEARFRPGHAERQGAAALMDPPT